MVVFKIKILFSAIAVLNKKQYLHLEKNSHFLHCLISLGLFAQKPKVQNEPTHDDRSLHFGFSLGLNTMDFRIVQPEGSLTIADVTTLQPGFHVHAISNFRIAEYFDLRILPGISFGGERSITFLDTILNHEVIAENNPVRLESNFIELPFLIKYKAARVNNFRPYIIGGTNLKFDLAATKMNWGSADEKNKNPILLKVFDQYLELGFGMDFILNISNFQPKLSMPGEWGI
ncbi:MAG: PorT family protein [Bacteroidales bacterium]|nr:PorT family protein [Bacteroidales bacterium]